MKNRDDNQLQTKERDLHEDADWKRIQINTFTRWVNEHLKKANLEIFSLKDDFSNGLRLIALVEVLSGKKMCKHNLKPKFRSQKLENVSLVLRYLEEQERIKIVNIDSTHIVDCQIKLILGLIWTLILHYSISMPMFDQDMNGHAENNSAETPKQKLLNWLRKKVSDSVQINNFTTDWQNGIALGSMIECLQPGLCPNWVHWKPSNALQNTKTAMDLADKWLCIPQLIQPEDVIDTNVDELSMMTYLSQYPKAQPQPNFPIQHYVDLNKIRCYGKGIERNGLVVDESAEFCVETFHPHKGELVTYFIRENGQRQKISTCFNNDTNFTYTCSYVTVSTPGLQRVHVLFNDLEVPHSPFLVHVGEPRWKLSEISVYGPGVSPDGVVYKQSTHFYVRGKGITETDLVAIVAPRDESHAAHETVHVTRHSALEWRCEYTPHRTGHYVIRVSVGGLYLPSSPFSVCCLPDVSCVRVTGKGILSSGIYVGDVCRFQVHTEMAGKADCNVDIITSTGEHLTNQLQLTAVAHTHAAYTCTYTALTAGEHLIHVTYGSLNVPFSPFRVTVAPIRRRDTAHVKCFGPGLSSGYVDRPCVFMINSRDTVAADAELTFAVRGPSKAALSCASEHGVTRVTYTVTEVGQYAVHVFADEEDVSQSPWLVDILPCPPEDGQEHLVRQVQVSGLDFSSPVKSGTEIPIRLSNVFSDDVIVKVLNDVGDSTSFDVRRVSSTDCEAILFLESFGAMFLEIIINDIPVAGFPRSFFVVNSSRIDPSQVTLSGPCVVTDQVPVGVDTHFLVNCCAPDIDWSRDIRVRVADTAGRTVPCDMVTTSSSNSGSQSPAAATHTLQSACCVSFQPPRAGPFDIHVTDAEGVCLAQTPLRRWAVDTGTSPGGCAAAVQLAECLATDIMIGSFADITLRVPLPAAAAAAESEEVTDIEARVTDPHSQVFRPTVERVEADVVRVSFVPELIGPHSVDIRCDSQLVCGCPFVLHAREGVDPSRVRLQGEGLTHAVCDTPNQFTIVTRGAGMGKIGLGVEGPSKADVSFDDHCDGTCTVTYVPHAPGLYDIAVKFADQPLPDSPIQVVAKTKSSKQGIGKKTLSDVIRICGPGIVDMDCTDGADEPSEVALVNTPVVFTVHCLDGVDPKSLNIAMQDSSGTNIPVTSSIVTGKTLAAAVVECSFVPTRAGNHVLTVCTRSSPHRTPRGSGAASAADSVRRNVHVVMATRSPITVDHSAWTCAPGGVVVGRMYPIVVTNKIDSGDICRANFKYECLSMHNMKRCNESKMAIKCMRSEDNSTHTFECIPLTAGQYKFILHDEKHREIPEGSFQIQVLDVARDSPLMRADALPLNACSPEDEFFRAHPLRLDGVDVPGPNYQVKVITPHGNCESARVDYDSANRATVNYIPHVHGLHRIQFVDEHDSPRPAMDLEYFVPQYNQHVTAYGTGLVYSKAGKDASFSLDNTNNTQGKLTLQIEGPEKTDIVSKNKGDGTMHISFIPPVAGIYKIAIKLHDEHINGSPFTVNVAENTETCVSSDFDLCQYVRLNSMPADLPDLSLISASIVRPSGVEESVFLNRLNDQKIGVAYSPTETGMHKIHLRTIADGKAVAGSPANIYISSSDIGNVANVRVSGDGLKRGHVHKQNQMTVDVSDAGYGTLDLSLEGPSKASIDCSGEKGVFAISYTPALAGVYTMKLLFANQHVSGSPFSIQVSDDGASSSPETASTSLTRHALGSAACHCRATFNLEGVAVDDLRAKIVAPSGTVVKHEITAASSDRADQTAATGALVVTFRPGERGRHEIHLSACGVPVTGSPFPFDVSAAQVGGASCVRAEGLGLSRGCPQATNEFLVHMEGAGAGSLGVSLSGPSKAQVTYTEPNADTCVIRYCVTRPGEYKLNVTFDGVDISGSPFYVSVDETHRKLLNNNSTCQSNASSSTTINALLEQNFDNCLLLINRPVKFSVSATGDTARAVECRVHRVGAEPANQVQPPDGGGESLLCRLLESTEGSGEEAMGGRQTWQFTPRQPGPHTLSVLLEGRHVRGSPVTLHVQEAEEEAASETAAGFGVDTICVRGRGLMRARTGFPAEILLSRFYQGQVQISVEGPHNVEFTCIEVEGEHKLTYVANSPGQYTIELLYNGRHVAESPYTANVTGREIVKVREGTRQRSCLVIEATLSSSRTRRSELTEKCTRTTTTSSSTRASQEHSTYQLPEFVSDASRVVVSGEESLRSVSVGLWNSLHVDTSLAGNNMLLVGCYGREAPLDELRVKHVQAGTYEVRFKPCSSGLYWLFVRWGTDHVPGSPFCFTA